MKKKSQNTARVAVIVGAAFTLIFVSTLFALAWPVLTVEAGPTLTPCDRPAPSQDDKYGTGGSTPVGTYIELQAPSFPAGTWTVIQWQDSASGWGARRLQTVVVRRPRISTPGRFAGLWPRGQGIRRWS
jgi:hypothetical protein